MFKNVTRNWKTTLLGILSLVTASVQASNTPQVLSSPEFVTQILVGLGLILAKDGSKSGTAEVPKDY